MKKFEEVKGLLINRTQLLIIITWTVIYILQKEHPESKEFSLVFIRDLFGTSIFHAVIDGKSTCYINLSYYPLSSPLSTVSGSSARYNEDLLDSRMEVVTKYIQPQNDSQHQRQVEFLCAMQMVLHDLKHPAGKMM